MAPLLFVPHSGLLLHPRRPHTHLRRLTSGSCPRSLTHRRASLPPPGSWSASYSFHSLTTAPKVIRGLHRCIDTFPSSIPECVLLPGNHSHPSAVVARLEATISTCAFPLCPHTLYPGPHVAPFASTPAAQFSTTARRARCIKLRDPLCFLLTPYSGYQPGPFHLTLVS